jgi:hypothetical protein
LEVPAASAFANNSDIEREIGESSLRFVARSLRETYPAYFGDIAVRGHSFQIGANAAFWSLKARDGTNAFRTRYFGRWDVSRLPEAGTFAFLSTAALTNDKLRRETSPIRRRLSYLRPSAAGLAPRRQDAQTNIVYLAATHLPDRYGRRCG